MIDVLRQYLGESKHVVVRKRAELPDVGAKGQLGPQISIGDVTRAKEEHER